MHSIAYSWNPIFFVSNNFNQNSRLVKDHHWNRIRFKSNLVKGFHFKFYRECFGKNFVRTKTSNFVSFHQFKGANVVFLDQDLNFKDNFTIQYESIRNIYTFWLWYE